MRDGGTITKKAAPAGARDGPYESIQVGLAARQLLIARQKLGSKKQGTVEIYCSMISN